MLYAIYEGFFADVEKKLNRIAKKCAKYGNEFTFDVVGKEIREMKNEDDFVVNYKFILVEVEGTAKIDNWECVAVLENHNSGNIIRRINTEIEMPERFKHTENLCEHCNSIRKRNNLFVIHNVKTDEWKQVGGNCLKLYTSGLNLEYVTAYMDGITELEKYDGNTMGMSGKRYYKVEDVLSFAVEIIEKLGYFNAESDLPTKCLVREMLGSPLSMAVGYVNKLLARCRINREFCKEDFYKDSTENTVKAIMEYYSNLEDNSEFIHNVKVMLAEGYVTSDCFGYLAYLPKGYERHLIGEIEKAKRLEEKSKAKHFGEVGKRYKDMEITSIELATSWETEFGWTSIYRIVLENGAVLVWKTSNSLYLEQGKDYDKISFSVKAHNEYRGEKQTEVTRCKVIYKDKE